MMKTQPKLKISEAVTCAIKEQDTSIRKLANELNMKHPQICRITNGQNYNIDTLLKVIGGLGLELLIQKKKFECGGK